MRDAFNQVRGVDRQDASADTRISAWERFLGAFKENNPYSSNDESMRTEATDRINKLQGERKLARRQVASVSTSVAGLAISGEFKDCDYCPEMC